MNHNTLVLSSGLTVLALASSTFAGGATATLTVQSAAGAAGETVRLPIWLQTPDTIGLVQFNVASSGLLVEEIDYTGLIFSQGWDGFDNAPSTNTFVSGACIFPQDQVTGNLLFVDLLVKIPVGAAPGAIFPLTLTSAHVSDYTFTPFVVSVLSGEIHVTSGAACAEDLTGDGHVDFVDLLDMLSQWGGCAGCDSDLDGDNAVGLGDLLRVLAAWGPCAE